MRFLGLFIFGVCFAYSAFSQTFFPDPANLLSAEVTPGQANEVYIHFNNPSGDTLWLKWRRLEMNMPEGWNIDLCDYGHCYGGVPSSSTMNFIHGNIQAYLKLIVQPDTVAGSAWLWFKVFELNNESNFQDVYFSLYTPGYTRTNEPAAPALRLYPNPVRDILFLENTQPAERSLRLFNAQGKLVLEQTLPPLGRVEWPVQDLPSGLYYGFDGTNKPYIFSKL